MIAEGNETPGADAGGGEGRGRRGEGDFLAERRARRAAESGEHALTLRAEAAEATVRTLETHVASLQRRLQDAEEESRRVAELLDAAQAARAAERPEGAPRRTGAADAAPALERELQRAAQREYAEQRLRIEAEDRGAEREREARGELDTLRRRVAAGERDVEALAARLETAERELVEAEQAAAAERVSAARAERAVHARVGELESRAEQLEALLADERAARGRAERALEQLRSAQRTAQALLGGLAETVARLRDAALRAEVQAPPLASSQLLQRPHGESASQVPPLPQSPPVQTTPPEATPPQPLRPAVAEAPRAPMPRAPRVPRERPSEAQSGEMADALAAAVERLRARVEEQAAPEPTPVAQPRTQLPSHKHAMSLIGRTRLRLRLRRERRKQRS